MSSHRSEIEAVYDRFEQQFFTCALGITGCTALAEDAVQEAVFKCLRLEVKPENLKAYMFRSVRNAAIDILRKRGKESSLADNYIFASSPNPAELLQEKQFHQAVAKALVGLSDDESETIVQHLYADLTFREIADLRERSLGTVASWYRRGLEKLRKIMESNDG